MSFHNWILILWLLSYVSLIRCQSTNTTTNTPLNIVPINYCVGPLVQSSHKNPVQDYGGPFSNCGLSCETGKKIYGLSPKQQDLVDYTTIIGTILCLVGLFILSFNLYYDTKRSTEKFTNKPILFHIPYIITMSTFILTLLMALSLIFGKETVLCSGSDLSEFSYWNPGYGKSVACTTFGIFFYSSLLYYMFYVLLLSFIVWRQFKNPLNPLWHIRDRNWHLFIFICVLFLNITALGTSSVDAIEPMGVCLAGVADKKQLFGFVIFPMIISCVFSAIFLIYSGILVKNNINKHKNIINKTATMRMTDLFKRILWYGFGVLFTLSLLFATGLRFYLSHTDVRDGLKIWINCELNNALMGLNIDCDNLRNDKYKQSPFWFMSWIISCFMAILAQTILSFHSKARQRAVMLKQKTLNKIATKIHSPKHSKESNHNLPKKLEELKSEEDSDDEIQLSPVTTTAEIQTNSANTNINMTQINSKSNGSSTMQSINMNMMEQAVSE